MSTVVPPVSQFFLIKIIWKIIKIPLDPTCQLQRIFINKNILRKEIKIRLDPTYQPQKTFLNKK